MLFACCALTALSALTGCSNAAEEAQADDEAVDPQSAALEQAGEAVKPPFEVKGELEGLLLVWFDQDGQHTAARASEVPEGQREHVRIDSLAVAPDKRLDADHVYVADLRKPQADGSYAVQKRTREWLDAHVQSLAPVPTAPSGDVTLYMASWCGACKAAAAYLRSRDVPFVEKDIERDASAAAEMQQKAQAAGKTPRGVPVIDFRGTLLLGYDQAALATLIDKP
jgi:glutaredoxin